MEKEKFLNRITKRILKWVIGIFFFILIVYALSLSFTYNIWKNAGYLLNPENMKIYGIVCKNVDPGLSALNTLEISSNINDSYIKVCLNDPFFNIIYVPFIILSKPEPYSHIDKMFKMYEDLSAYDRSVRITIDDAMPSDSGKGYYLCDGKLYIDEYGGRETAIYYAIESAISHRYVTKLYLLTFGLLNNLSEELPVNYSIKYLYCSIVNWGDPDIDINTKINISKFKGLQSLEIRVSEYEDSCFNLNFINEMPELETLILHCDNLDFSDETKYTGIKNVTIYTDIYTADDEELFHKAFPNAGIEIKCDEYYDFHWNIYGEKATPVSSEDTGVSYSLPPLG